MPLFKIEYKEPGTDIIRTIAARFEDTPTVAAREWAEDRAYMLADKGWHRVTEVKDPLRTNQKGTP